MIAYLDSSALLRIVLGDERRLRGLHGYETVVSSELVEVESLRVIDRARLLQKLDETELVDRREYLYRLLEGCQLLELSRAILRRASDPFPVALGTLDAIHLATALAWRDEHGPGLVMVTHDLALGKACKALAIASDGLSG